jgi:hypothetical protein
VRKKFLVLSLLLVLSLSLASCAKTGITYGLYIYQSGEIVQAFEVKIDADSLQNTGYDAETVCKIVEIVFQSNLYATEIRENNVVYAERYFESRTDYNIFYGITGDEPADEYDENFYRVGGVFFDTYVSKGESVFGGIEEIIASVRQSGFLNPTGEISAKDEALISMIKDELLTLDYELFTYVYKYNTYLDSVDFNADEKSFDAETGLHIFTFFMDHSTKGRIIESEQRVSNIAAWFLTAAGISALVVLAVYGIGAAAKKTESAVGKVKGI